MGVINLCSVARASIVVALLWSFSPIIASAQDDFGFDLSGDGKKKKKKKKGKKKKQKKTPQAAETKMAPRVKEADTETKAAPGAKESVAKPADSETGAKPLTKEAVAKPGTKETRAKPARDAGGFGFEALDVSIKSPEKEAMEKALDLMRDEKYDDAAVTFWDVYNNPKAKQFFESSEYQLAKALYRMRLYHSALRHFGQVLEKGPEHKYFKTSLEWLFFISHKIKDQRRVLDYIAKYSDVEFPKKYRDEFLFLLAKYFYFRALDLEEGRVLATPAHKQKAKAKGKAAADGFGFDLAGDGGGGAGGGGAEGGLDLGEKASGGDAFGLDLKAEKKTGPTALPTDVVGFLSKSKALVLQIGETSKWYTKGKYLEGIIFFKEGNFQEAVESFRKVVTILNPAKGKYRDDELRELSFFQLARTHYGHKQFNSALFYYDHISRDSTSWLESLFESSWAWFRIGKYQKALGNLITLDSPFFRDEYFPEGLVLKAVTYYENCRYPESNQIVSEFLSRYKPLHTELESLTAKEMAPENYYKKLLDIQKAVPEGESGQLLRRILKVALADRDLALLNQSVLEIDSELRLIGRKGAFTTSKVAGRLNDALQKQREELVQKAGLFTRVRLEQERDALASLISQALRIKLENDSSELDMLKRAKAGDLDLGPTLLTYDWTAATDDEKIYWPYEGEYWRDELGTYEYTLTWGCRKQVE